MAGYIQLPEARIPKFNTLMDAYQQKQQIESNSLANLRNRIEVENAMMQQGINKGKLNIISNGVRGQQEAMIAGEMMQRQAQQQQEAQQLKQASDTLTSLRKVMGTSGLKKNWNTIKNINPIFENMNPENITADGYIAKDQSGNVLGQWIQNPEGGAPHFVAVPREPVGTESVYRQGIEKQLIASGVPKGRAAFEAAKQVIEEKKRAALQKVQFSVDVRRGAGRRGASQPEGTATPTAPTTVNSSVVAPGRKISPSQASNVPFNQWTPQEKSDKFTAYFMSGGRERPFGIRDKVNNADFQREQSKWLKERGLTMGQAMNMGTQLKSVNKAVDKQATLTARYDAGINKALAAADIALSANKEYERYGLKAVNSIKAFKDAHLGNQDVQMQFAKQRQSLNTFGNEYVKIITGGVTSTAESSIHAQEMQEKLLDPNNSAQVQAAIINQMKTEMSAALQAEHSELGRLEEQKSAIAGRFDGTTPGQTATMPQPVQIGAPKQQQASQENDPLGIR